MKSFRVLASIVMLTILVLIPGCKNPSRNNEMFDEIADEGKYSLVPIINNEKAEEYSKLAAQNSYAEKISDAEVISINLADSGFSTPAGIVLYDEGFLISDSDNNCLKLIDITGETNQVIGQIGNAEGEFLHPTGIDRWEDKYFIIDSGNDRIVVLDSSLNYQDQIQLPDVKFGPEDQFTDIAIDKDGDIYVCGSFINSSGIYYKPNNSDEFTRVAEGFYGSLSKKDGIVYALNYGNIFVDKKEQLAGVCGGDNRVWKITKGEETEICILPIGVIPESFVITSEGNITVMSSYEMGLLTYDGTDGNYLITEYKYNEGKAPYESYMITDGKRIYMVDKEGRNLLVINYK